jgi:hypothetical protein
MKYCQLNTRKFTGWYLGWSGGGRAELENPQEDLRSALGVSRSPENSQMQYGKILPVATWISKPPLWPIIYFYIFILLLQNK